MKATTEILVERNVLVSETTKLPNGFVSKLPSFDWEITSWQFFVATVRMFFNEESAEKVIEHALDPDNDNRTDEGWFHVSVPVKRHGIVGQFTGTLRVNLGG